MNDVERENLRHSLMAWMIWCCDEQMMTRVMTVSYMPDKSPDYREGRIQALRDAEARLGILMGAAGIDLTKGAHNDQHADSGAH